MDSKKEIRYDSLEAAQFKTGISGWVSRDGRFWGKDEHMARYTGCTHVVCQSCGAVIEKSYLKCESCRWKTSVEKWAALPFMAWDGVAPLCTWDGEDYFFTEHDLIDYLEENRLEGKDLMLVICEPITYREIDYGMLADDAHEDWEPPKKLVDAVEKVNALLRELPPHSYTVGKIRTSYDYIPDHIIEETPIQ